MVSRIIPSIFWKCRERSHASLDVACELLNTKIKEPITYCIILQIVTGCWIQIGKKGRIYFEPGYYAYVGSAKKNASSRMSRHWLGTGKRKWHIDYLRAEANPQSIWAFSQVNLGECQLADQFLKSGVGIIPGFGSSDCCCPSHLFFCTTLSILEDQLSSRPEIDLKHNSKIGKGYDHA